MNARTLLSWAVLAATGAAHAQLVFGHTYYSSSNVALSGAYYLDIGTGSAQQLWTGANNKKVSGLTADRAGKTLWGADNARLYHWEYGNVGTPPTFVNGFYRLGSNGTVYATFVGSLGFAQGKLYAYTNYNLLGSGPYVEDGIYEIDTTITTSGTPNMNLVWRHDDLAYNFEGFDYNPDDGLFYATNNPNDPSQRGLYTIDLFGGATITKIADYDSWLPTPDGLAVGGGYVWMTSKLTDDTQLKITGYNMLTKTYDKSFVLDGFTTTGRFTGAAWAPGAPVPEPATMLVLGVGLAGAWIRRRR